MTLTSSAAVFVLFLRLTLSLAAKQQHHNPLLSGAETFKEEKGFHPDIFLRHFGYLGNRRGLLRNSRTARRLAISLYQRNYGLNVTGKLNKQTWRLMLRPRCGNPDIGTQTLPTTAEPASPVCDGQCRKRVKRNALKRAKQIDTYEYRWLQRKITWSPTRFFHRLPVDTQWKALKKAFDIWSEPSQLNLTYDPVNPDIRLSFWRREHGDGLDNAFDGRGPTSADGLLSGRLLAHAFPPGDVDLSGDIHFDSDEEWSVGKSSGRNKDLVMIALHEVGHAIGLGHSKKKKDIMFPVYGSFTPNPALSRHDVKRLRRLYGKNPAYKWSPPPANISKPRKTMRRKQPRWCRMPFNDVIRGPYGHKYIFSKRYVYRFNSKGVENGYPINVKQEFPGAPVNPLAVVHVREKTRTFFFKGKRMWRFSNYTLDTGYPKPVRPVFPEKPRAALNIRSRKGYSTVYIFGTQFFWQWNYETERVSSAFLYIKDFWKGLPSKIDAAVHWTDNYVYFFRHNKYYKFSKDRHQVMRGYPKIKGPAWLRGACGQKPK